MPVLAGLHRQVNLLQLLPEGYANPTLTIVALSIRIADRIKTLLNQAPELTVAAGTPTSDSMQFSPEPVLAGRNAPSLQSPALQTTIAASL